MRRFSEETKPHPQKKLVNFIDRLTPALDCKTMNDTVRLVDIMQFQKYEEFIQFNSSADKNATYVRRSTQVFQFQRVLARLLQNGSHPEVRRLRRQTYGTLYVVGVGQ